MSVATDLQTVIARLGEDALKRVPYGRTELERLVRELSGIREDASRLQSGAYTAHRSLLELADGVDQGRAELGKLSRRVRDRAAGAAKLLPAAEQVAA